MHSPETSKGATRTGDALQKSDADPWQVRRQICNQSENITPPPSTPQALRRAENDKVVATFPKNSRAEFRVALRDDAKCGHVVISVIETNPTTGESRLKSGLGLSIAQIPRLIAALEQAAEQAEGSRQ